MKGINTLKKIAAAALLITSIWAGAGKTGVYASEEDPKPTPTPVPEADYSQSYENDGDRQITNADRDAAYLILTNEVDTLIRQTQPSKEALQHIYDTFYEANVFIANNSMTVSELNMYVERMKVNIQTAASNPTAGAKEFLFINNASKITSARYSQQAALNLNIINLGKSNVYDLVITPNVDTDINKWPFLIATASDARMIDVVQAGSTLEEAILLGKGATWTFVVSPDAKTGMYPITFHARYYRNNAIEEVDLKTYINITGAPGSGSLVSQEEGGKMSTPRIIITGFTTDPADVYAGDTFNLTVSVQNTSSQTSVSNIQFDLKAAQEGKDEVYEAFLPTSGSSTIYVDRIAPGETKDISIEMSARSDLTKKPYVITVSAEYEDEKNNSYKMDSNVSIPINQEARVDTSDAEVMPQSISVGESSNIMFSVYNKGKTTLYNVEVVMSGETIDNATTFIGKIEPGGTGNVDVMVNGIMGTMDDPNITASVNYEDEAGNVTTLEKQIELYVNEPYYDEGMYDEGMYDEGMYGEGEEGGKGGILKWILIGAAVLVAIIVIVLIILSKKKKKKARQAELDFLEEDEEIMDLDGEESYPEDEIYPEDEEYTEDEGSDTDDGDGDK
ncbi:MAG: hypothetical protein K6B44_05600 [Lachnospiraceae bacterium]|nr:hypothetical protein [Lachnospiraceae bacterium]